MQTLHQEFNQLLSMLVPSASEISVSYTYIRSSDPKGFYSGFGGQSKFGREFDLHVEISKIKNL